MKKYSTADRGTHWKFTNASHRSAKRLVIRNHRRELKKAYRQRLKTQLKKLIKDLSYNG